MVTVRIGSCFLFAAGLWAANINVAVTGVTPTQAVVTYSATSPNPCIIALSQSSTMSPLANDVNPVLFPAANSDARPGSLSHGVARTVVLGKRSVEPGADGKRYSRALQAYSTYYFQVSCNGGADTGTAAFATANPPLGNNYPEVPLFDPTEFGNYAQPTINVLNQNATYIDPLTGLLMRVASSPLDTVDTSLVNVAFTGVIDQASAWTNSGNIITNSQYATYAGSGASSASLFLSASPSIPGPHGYEVETNIIDARLHLNGSGTDAAAANRTLSACISQDHGQTCYGAAIDLPALPQNSPAVVSFPSTYPAPVFASWTAPGATPVITPNIVARSGSVTISGTALTLNSGDTFQDLAPGDVLSVPGSGCPNANQCVIAAVVNANALTLATSQQTFTGSYTANNFGWKIWKKTGAGSVSVNSARYDYTIFNTMNMPVSGAYSQCSTVPAVTTVDRNGNPLGYSQNGYLCVQDEVWGNIHLYWHGSNGEVRYISPLVRYAVNSPAADVTSLAYACPVAGGAVQASPFDFYDPNSLYCVGTKTGNPAQYDVVYKCTYNSSDPTWGNYVAWNPLSTTTNDNPAMSCVNITKASLGNDLNSQGVPAGYSISAGNTSGPYLSFAPLVVQNGIAWFVRFNTQTGRVEYIHDSYSSSPRWGTLHGSASIGVGYGSLYIAPMRSASEAGVGQYQVTIASIDGLGGATALTNTYTDTRTCQQMGVANPVFIAQGATGNSCISVTVTGEPYNPTPAAQDLASYPWPHNSAACGGDNTTSNCWSQLQISQEGDFMIDSGYPAGGYYEQFRIVKKLSATNWILQRGASRADCTVTQITAHPSGWIPIMWPAGECGAVSYYFATSNGAVSFDAANMNEAHNDFLTSGVSGSGTFVQSGYNIRTGTIASQIGQEATFNSYGSYGPVFAGSTAAMNLGDIQSHPSCRQFDASTGDFVWCLDGRPYGGALGGSTSLFYQTVTATAVSGVYKVGVPTNGPGGTGGAMSALDRKNLPMDVWAGRYLLTDKSGPGSVIASGDLWNYCVADFAGECMAGSSAGDVYMNVPQAVTNGVCLGQLEQNTPCWTSASPVTPFITQFNVAQPDPAPGLYWRRLSNFFNGMGWTDNFWNARALPDASWMFSDAKWLNGSVTTLVTAKLPPWPAVDNIQRSAFIPVTLQINGTAQRTYRARFGYDTNLFCTTRQEQCATAASGSAPFLWASEQQSWTSCNGACQISIPAISGRVLYYVVDAMDANGVVASAPINAFPVP